MKGRFASPAYSIQWALAVKPGARLNAIGLSCIRRMKLQTREFGLVVEIHGQLQDVTIVDNWHSQWPHDMNIGVVQSRFAAALEFGA